MYRGVDLVERNLLFLYAVQSSFSQSPSACSARLGRNMSSLFSLVKIVAIVHSERAMFVYMYAPTDERVIVGDSVEYGVREKSMC